MADHILKPSRKNLHGSLSKSIPPVLTITPGGNGGFYYPGGRLADCTA